MKKVLLVLPLILVSTSLFSQYIEKVWFDRTDEQYGFYTVSKPFSGRVQGVLFLLDGFGGNADQLYAETKIHNVAWVNDLLIVGIPTGRRLYLDTSMARLMNNIIGETIRTYALRKDQVAIGGMSSGGAIALKYTERCYAEPAKYPALPTAVFDVDSPLDLVSLYRASRRELSKDNGGWWLGEANMIIETLKKDVGDPDVSVEPYKLVSPFVREAKDSANERLLSSVAVRTYHDVDINWHLKNRARSIYETNAPDGSELIARLNKLGNARAEFVQSAVHGRRSNGMFHPHSWNIAEEVDLVQWVKESLHFYPDHLRNRFEYKAPANWNAEVIVFPIDFAPGLMYKGFEELRFAPDWGDANSEQRWAYTLLWWLDSAYQFNEAILRTDLETYFAGLTKRRAIADKQDLSQWKEPVADVRKTKTMAGDIQTYSGQMAVYDAQVTRKPATLYVKIHLKDCPDKDKVVLLLEVAGSRFDQPVWNTLDSINKQFRFETTHTTKE